MKTIGMRMMKNIEKKKNEIVDWQWKNFTTENKHKQ